MNNQTLISKSFVHALGAFLYVFLVAWTMSHIKVIFGPGPDNFFAPLFVLLLFLISALVTGLLILGRPVYLYLEGKKKEAVQFIIATLIWLIVFFAGVIVLIVLH